MKLPKILSTVVLAGTLSTSSLALAATAAETGSLSPNQVDQVKKVVHDYLVSNPQVLVEASEALQKQEMAKAEKKAQGAIVGNAQMIFEDPISPVGGNPKGDVTLVEFFDYQCPHCKEMEPIVAKIVQTDPNLRVVYKELPIFGDDSRYATQAALAAAQQGGDKYAKFHDALLNAPNPLNKDKIMQIAQSVGLNTDQLQKDINSDAIKKQIDDNYKLAQTLGLVGTPTFIISKWQVGAKDNSAKQAAFLPGAVSQDTLTQSISQARGK